MKIYIFLLTLLKNLIFRQCYVQIYPTFGPEKSVAITGLIFDAMKPFISSDGSTLYFNSLNSGANTSLYYATKVNGTSFIYGQTLPE